VKIDIAFKRQDIRVVSTRHRSGCGSVFSHSIPSSSLHQHPAVSLDSPMIATAKRSSPDAISDPRTLYSARRSVRLNRPE
jgi:hypothetical protein